MLLKWRHQAVGGESWPVSALLHRLRKKDVETPFVVRVSLLEGHVSPREADRAELAAVTTERWYRAPGVKRTAVRHDGVIGTLFLPPGEFWSVCSGRSESAASSERWFPAGPGPFPAMLDLWGMSGGLVEYRAALFASRGYASLSLAYIGHKELPAPHNRIMVGDSYFKVKYATSCLQKFFFRFLKCIYFWTEGIPPTSGSSSSLCWQSWDHRSLLWGLSDSSNSRTAWRQCMFGSLY